jgi:hypothetical protein
MSLIPPTERNAEIFIRHCAGDSYSALGRAYGISKARAAKIAEQTAEKLLLGLPIASVAGKERTVFKGGERV